MNEGRPLLLILVLSLALVGASLGSLAIGYIALPPGEVLRALVMPGGEDLTSRAAAEAAIVRELRLPRLLLTLAIGAAMGLSGAVLQGLLRNPLAEPGVIGITASASLGAVVALYFGYASLFPLALPMSAMLGAAVATAVLYVIAAREESVLTLILAGVAISSFAVALSSLAMNLSPNPWAVTEILFWLMGSVRDRSLFDVMLAGPFIALGMLLLFCCGRPLDALSLGEEGARSLGVDLRLARILAVFGTSLAVGASVAVAGAIGFIGLVVPHLLRPLVGHLPSRLLLPSALGGALLLTLADIGVRLIRQGPELNLGVVTALIGAPFFLYLIVKTRRDLR